MISDKSLKKFKALYHNEYDINLDDEDVLRKATQLLELFRVIYGEVSQDYQSKD